MLRDKRTLALMMVAPLLILTLVHFLFTSESNEKPQLGVINGDVTLVESLAQELSVHEYKQVNNVKEIIADDKLDGLLQIVG